MGVTWRMASSGASHGGFGGLAPIKTLYTPIKQARFTLKQVVSGLQTRTFKLVRRDRSFRKQLLSGE